MKKNYFLLLVPVSLAALFFACSGEKKETAKSVVDDSAIAVKLVNVEQDEYSLPVISSGLISTETESRLSFKVPGIITKIYVKEGDAITKGQLLASLDLTEIDAQVSQAKNAMEKATRDFERGQRLFKDSAATLEQIQNLQTAFNVSQESYRIASFNKQYSTIHALASGRVIKKYLNEGELASPGVPVLVVNTSAQNNWIVKVGLPDVDWVRVKTGDKVTITTDAYPNTELQGELTAVNEGSELVTGLYQAEVKINADGKKLASGLFAKVKIQPSNKQKLWSVPIESLVEGQGKTASVFVVQSDNKSVKKVTVQVAYLENKKAFIAAGLENITQVVEAGSAFLTENSVVSIAKN
jgi:RND family efflux transporter MFP subunit